MTGEEAIATALLHGGTAWQFTSPNVIGCWFIFDPGYDQYSGPPHVLATVYNAEVKLEDAALAYCARHGLLPEATDDDSDH